MTIKSKNNYNETRKLAKDISEIVGLSKRLVVHFTRILSLGYATQIASQALNKEDGKLKDIYLEIPYVGRMTANVEKDSLSNVTLTLDKEFEKQIIKAVNTGETNLMTELEYALVENIKAKYNALL